MGKTIVVALMGMVLVGLASAGFVGFLSNVVVGEIVILGPVFYTASGENLIMNDEPGSSSTKTINGIEKIDFIMEEELGGLDFYKPELNFVVDLEINNFSSPRGIELEFGYIKENGNGVKICNIQHIGIEESDLDEPLEVSCDGEVVPTDVKFFYYTVEGMGDEYLEYKIKTKNSYVEIMGVLP